MDKLTKREWPLFSLNDWDTFLDSFWSNRTVQRSFPDPQMRATENELTLQFALAGYPKDKLSVEVAGDTVTVKGEKVENEDNLFAGRAFTWSRKDARNEWDFSKAEVKHENGMLTIKAPRKAELKPKALEIS